MEVYDADNCICDLPVPFDNSLTVKGFIECFSARSKATSKSIINKYTFSYGQTYLCIAPSGSQYRVIGRLFKSTNIKPVKRCADFDVYKIGAHIECVEFFSKCVHSELLDRFLL